VVHACNPSYTGGRDQEDCSSKPAQTNSSQDLILKIPITKNWTGGVAQGKGTEFKPQYHKKEKKEKEKKNKMLKNMYILFLKVLTPPKKIENLNKTKTQKKSPNFQRVNCQNVINI
jgi:hypothetical protein